MAIFTYVSSIILSVLFTASLLCLAIYIFRCLRKKQWTGAVNWGLRSIDAAWLYLLSGFVICAGMYVLAGFQTSRQAESELPPVTEENSPVNMFLQLTPDITMEQVMTQTNDRDWEFVLGDGGSRLAEAVGAPVRLIQIVPDWSEDSQVETKFSYTLHQDLNGEILELFFATPENGSSWLVYARLTMRTDDGFANCYYYPTSFTQLGGKTGFNLDVKGAKQLFKKSYLLDSPQGVIDIAKPIVYPNGR
jgi:hypothetical protein